MTPPEPPASGPAAPGTTPDPLHEIAPAATRAPRAWQESMQPVVIAWLTVVWVLLWGDLSVANVLSGLLVSVLVLAVFPLPALRMHLRVRPLRLAWLIIHFLASVVVASVQVSRTTLRFGHVPTNAVIKVDLRTSSDFVLTVVAELTALIPGSIVIEADRVRHALYIHVLDVKTLEDVEHFREQTFALERRVILALGADTEPVAAEPSKPEAGR